MSTRAIRAVALATMGSLVLAACVGGPPGAPGGGPGQGKPSGKPEIAAVSVGTALIVRDVLSPTLNYSGNVQARTQVNLVPKISARLEKLNADIGDEIKAGDIIAELDHLQLDAQVREAEAGVLSAEAKLEQTQASAKPEDIDAAAAVVEQSRIKLEQARAGGRPEEVAAAAAAANQALARADQVAAGAREAERMNLQAAIDRAESEQDQTRAQLIAAQQALSESKYRLDQARAGQGGPGVKLEDIVQAQSTLDTNRIKLSQLRNPRREDIRAAELEVELAEEALDAAEEARDNCGKGTTTTTNRGTTRTTQRSSSSAGSGTPTTETENENRTTTETRNRQTVTCSRSDKDALDADIAAAKVDLKIAQNELNIVRRPNPYNVAQAEQAVLTAEANLQKLRFGGTSDLASLELKLAQSQADVDRFQSTLDASTSSIVAAQMELDLAVNPDELEVAQVVAAAQQARANLARIANPDPFVVETARATLYQSEAQLAGELRPFTEQDIRVAAAAVDQASAALQTAQVQANEAIIRAPFDAIVSQKLLSPGAMASPNTPILALVSQDVEIVVQVEEARLGQIKKDQPATLTVSAFPGRVFGGRIAAISPSADTRSRTFAVRVVPAEQDKLLRDGMFAQVSIAGVGQPALLVPNEAIVTRSGRTLVFVVADDRAQAREVRLGETDGKQTAVLEGRLSAGDEIIMTNPESLVDGAPVIVERRNIQPGELPPRQSSTPGGSPSGSAPGLSPVLPSSSPQPGPGVAPPAGQGR